MELTTVIRTSRATAALKDGRVAPRGSTLLFEEVDPVNRAFRRMVRGLEFDVSEMAFTTYLVAKEFGRPFTALPVFLVRQFHHGAVLVNRRSGITGPKDLEGRRVGVNRGYTVTGGVWARGVLADEHGVDLDAITWAPSGDEHVTEYRPPANVVPLEQGADVAELLARGELPAAIGVAVDHPDVVPLVPDAQAAGLAALRARGHYPINHLVVVKDELLEAQPDLAADLVHAFERAKDVYLRSGDLEPLHAQVAAITGGDPLPYGVEPNRAAIEELVRHALAQKILTRAPDLDALFAR